MNQQTEQGESPEEIAEFQRGVEALTRALYEDKGVSDGVLGMFDPEQAVGSAAKAIITLVTEIDKKRRGVVVGSPKRSAVSKFASGLAAAVSRTFIARTTRCSTASWR